MPEGLFQKRVVCTKLDIYGFIRITFVIYTKYAIWLDQIQSISKYLNIANSHCMCNHSILIIEEEQTTQWPQDTKGAIRIRISKKNRQHNGQKKKCKSKFSPLVNIWILQIVIVCVITLYLYISDLSRVWLYCLGPVVYLLQKTIYHCAFQS
jgi:hypothetical protein